ncbi:hypothetical protein TNCV_2709291 [Trichonephila clavipes]|nr:hypothetical protein TNCV_2709291 [Trichonephila clavipes]
MFYDEIPERCKLNFTGIVDDALRIAGELFPKQTLKKYIRKEVEIDTDGRVRSRRFKKKEKSLKALESTQAKLRQTHFRCDLDGRNDKLNDQKEGRK